MFTSVADKSPIKVFAVSLKELQLYTQLLSISCLLQSLIYLAAVRD